MAYRTTLKEQVPALIDVIQTPTKYSLLDYFQSPVLSNNPFSEILVEKTSNPIMGGPVDSFQWEVSPNELASTIKLKELNFYDSGATQIKVKKGHWVRLLIVTKEDDFFQQNTTTPNSQILNVGEFLDTKYFNTNPSPTLGIYQSFTIYSWTVNESFIDVVLIGDNDDYLSIDVDGDVSGISKYRINIQGNNIGNNAEIDEDTWVTLIDYGTTKNSLPHKNSFSELVLKTGEQPYCEQGEFVWGTQLCTWYENEEIFEEDPIVINPINPIDDTDKPPPPSPPSEFELLQQNAGGNNNPFSRFSLFGDYVWENTTGKGSLRLIDNDTFIGGDSGGTWISIKEGYYVDLKIKIYNNYLRQTRAKIEGDELAIEKLSEDNKQFTYRLYGLNQLAVDIDKEYGFSTTSKLTGIQTNISFFLEGVLQEYAMSDKIDKDVKITLLDWGNGEYIPTPVNNECPDGFVFDELSQSCVPIDTVVTTDPSPTDPFDLFDDLGAPFDEDDGVLTRLTKSFAFSLRGSSKAIEAIIEGALMALPAVIIIGSAVVIGTYVVRKVEVTATKLEKININKKLFSNVKTTSRNIVEETGDFVGS